MGARKCLYIGNLGAGSAEDLRLLNSAVLGGTSFEEVTRGVGPIGRGHGVLTGEAFLPSAQVSPNNTVKIKKGACAIRGTQANSQGTYVVNLDVDTNVTISAKHATLVRKDYIVAQIQDAGYAAFSSGDNAWHLTTIDGTPGGDFPNVTHDTLVIAKVTVQPTSVRAGGPTVILSEDIEDVRPQARAIGGIVGVNSKSDLPNPQLGDAVYERSTSSYLFYGTSGWVTLGSNFSADWTTYTPHVGGVSGINASVYGRYARFGRMVTMVAGWKLNGNGSVSSALDFSLPVPAYNPGGDIHYMVGVRASPDGTNLYGGTAQITPGYNPSLILNLASAGSGAWGPGVPTTWTSNAFCLVLCNYEAVL